MAAPPHRPRGGSGPRAGAGVTPPIRSALRSLLLYAHDTYGLGHLRRNLAIADHLLARLPALRVVLLTGSPVAERFRAHPRLTLVRLPPVVKVGADDYRPRDPRWDASLVRRARTAIMRDVACRFRPDVFLVDHAPQGMKGELLGVFDALRRASPSTRLVLGLRDVVDDPLVVRRAWTEQGVYATLAATYDRILVYGCRELLDVVRAYRLPETTARRVTYCGYLGRPVTAIAAATSDPFVLGTAGGGGDGAEILAATITAARAAGRRSLIVTGPLMDQGDRARLVTLAADGGGSQVVEFVADLGSAMGAADAVVTMGGYNTLCEVVAQGAAAVVVPRRVPRREQEIRARLFAGRGLLRVVEPGEGFAERLTQALGAALAEGRPTTRRRLDLDGLPRVARALAREAVARHLGLEDRAPVTVLPAWEASASHRAAAAGARVAVPA